MLGFVLLLLEGIAFLTVQLVDKDDFFDSRQNVFARFSPAEFTEFKPKFGDPVTVVE